MVVCNHPGMLELHSLVNSPLFPAFTPKKETQKSPLLGPLASGVGSVFVPRGDGNNDAIVKILTDRQAQIADEGKKYRPLALFAEGTCTNGHYLSKFKRGAFLAMRPMTPCFVKFGDCMIKPQYHSLRFDALLILLLSSLSIYKTTLYIMPDFHPNEYMLENFEKFSKTDDSETQQKRPEDWEIYAWCVRDAMAKASGMGVSDLPLKPKIAYEQFMEHRRNSVEYNGKIYREKSCVNVGETTLNQQKDI